VYDTLPVPLPFAPAVTVIHGALLPAVHAHDPAFAVTDTVAAPPADVGELAVGEMDKAHTTGACVIVKLWPPTLIVAVRPLVFGFAATLYAMVALPVPLAALVTVSHGALLVAVQLQPAVAVIEKLPDAASDPTDTLAGDRA
jgi:hypothetical protein